MGVSVKQSRVMCIARIDESIQSTTDLTDFYSRVVKAENKVSNALWKTVHYPKPKKSDDHQFETSDHLIASNTTEMCNKRQSLDWCDFHGDRLITANLSRNGTCSTVASKAKKLLHCFSGANESRAEISACRATFHKKVTLTQLLLISETLQRFRALYIDRDTTLESYSMRLEDDVRECWKKYAKYADNVNRLRARLNTQLEKVTTTKRKVVESALNELENATFKLQTAHNAYTLSLSIARQYNKWLVHCIRPCLFRNLNRCLSLFDFAISFLLRLDTFEPIPEDADAFTETQQADLLGATEINNEIEIVGVNEDPFRRAFPFDEDLIVRAGDEVLKPDSIVVNKLTCHHIQTVLQTHKQESLTQKNMTTLFEDEHTDLVSSLEQWLMNLSSKKPLLDLPKLLGTDESMNTFLREAETWSSTVQISENERWPKILYEDRKFISTAMKPINLCTMAISLSTCEFFFCQSTCFADIHSRIVHILEDSHVASPPPLNGTHTLPLFSSSEELQAQNSDILESRFHCLRIQMDEMEKPIPSENHGKGLQNASDSEIDDGSISNPSPSDFLQFSTSTEQNRNHSLISDMKDRFSQSMKTNGRRLFDVTSSETPSSQLENVADNFNGNMTVSLFRSRLIRKETNLSQTSTSPEPPLNAVRQKSSISDSSRPVSAGVIALSKTPTSAAGYVSDTSQKSINEEEDVDINKEPWFHGVLPRTEVVRLLQSQGDFLVRETSKTKSISNSRRQHTRHREASLPSLLSSSRFSQSTDDVNSDWPEKTIVNKMVLSVYWDGCKHFIIQGGDNFDGERSSFSANGGWSLEDYAFPTIRDLIEYHMRLGKPVTAGSGALLLNPIARPDWQLENSDVKLLHKIGQGNFGEVHKGIYNGRTVAVKTCRANASEIEVRRKFLQGEATALNFCHPNIVQLIGIALRTHPIMIVMEYVSGGSLLSFLRTHGSNEKVSMLLRMSLDAAKGMEYLESKNCIHRDLAARNCLLTEEKLLKIADFGMAREEHVYELNDRNGPIPIKWTAPEALFSNRYTSKCDVWSFGVLLWEIFTAGDAPYRGLSNSETRDFVESGYRLATPDRMPRQLGKQMHNCWHPSPDRRPSFTNLVVSLTKLTESHLDRVECSESLVSTPRIAMVCFSPNQSSIGQVESPSNSVTKMKSKHRKRLSSSGDSDSRASTSRLPRLKPFTIQRFKSSKERT